MIVEKDGVVNCHWPQRKVSLVRPVYRQVDEHGSGGGLNVLDCFFSDAIGVMLSNAGELLSLTELFKVLFVFMAVKYGCVVTPVSFWNDTNVSAVRFK